MYTLLTNIIFHIIDCPPKVPPRNASIAASTGTVSLHRYSRQPGHKLQSPTSKPPLPPMQSTVTVVNTPTTHQERAMPKSAPPVVKPKPAGYRTYDCLNDDEEQVYTFKFVITITICIFYPNGLLCSFLCQFLQEQVLTCLLHCQLNQYHTSFHIRLSIACKCN